MLEALKGIETAPLTWKSACNVLYYEVNKNKAIQV